MIRVLVTGSRRWTDRHVIRRALLTVLAEHVHSGQVTLVHGGCRGADVLCAEEWTRLGVRYPGGLLTEVHPADWARHGRRAGPLRNERMVWAGADVCLAFPLGESYGTRHCMRLADAAGIPVRVFEPVTA